MDKHDWILIAVGFFVNEFVYFFLWLGCHRPTPATTVDAADDSRGLNMRGKLPLVLCLLTLAVVSVVASSLWLMSGFGLIALAIISHRSLHR